MVQRSVWIGGRNLSKEFYERLHDLSLSAYVKVIKINSETSRKVIEAITGLSLLFAVAYKFTDLFG